MMATCYYLIVWTQTMLLLDLVKAALAAFFVTVARYDGWAVLMGCVLVVVAVGCLRRHSLGRIYSNVLVFVLLGSLNIIFWLVWNQLLFGDALYFQRSVYSSQTQQAIMINAGHDRTYHNLWYSAHDFVVVSVETVGPILFVLGAVALVVYLVGRGPLPAKLAALVFLVPFAFYIVALYTGQAIIFAPGAAPASVNDTWYNVRYGMVAVPPVGVFTSTLVARLPPPRAALRLLSARVVVIPVIAAQALITFHGGVLAVQDGQVGFSCYPYSAIPDYLRRYYNGGYVLDDAYKTQTDIAASQVVTLSDVVYQGTHKLWQEALANPAAVVTWVIVAQGDAVSEQINTDGSEFNAQFELLLRDYTSGASLYHLRGLPPLPTRDLPPDPQEADYRLCGTIPLYTRTTRTASGASVEPARSPRPRGADRQYIGIRSSSRPPNQLSAIARTGGRRSTRAHA
jgi:hypothetical protein